MTSSWLGIPGTIEVFGTPIAPLTILLTVVIIVAGFAIAHSARIVMTRYISSHVPPDTRKTIGKVTYYVIIAIALLSALGVSGLNLSGLFFAGGIAGIVIGFATQSLFSNLISGIFLQIDKPMKIGDPVLITGKLPDVAGIAGIVGQRGAHRRHHFGAAIGLQRVDKGGSPADMLPVGRHGRREKHVHGVIEADHVETVAGLQAAERISEARLGLDDRDAAHRAGIVDHEDDLARQWLLLGLLDRRRRDEGEQVIAVADVLAEQPYRGRFLRRRFPGQFEVAVSRHRTFGQANDARAGIGLFGLDRMMVALDLAEREARL